MPRLGRWIAAACAVLALAACGGGDDPAPTPPADARNGDYTMIAANAREYTLTLNFDANTYHVVGNGLDQAGTITPNGNAFMFSPGNSVGASGTSTTRFTMATDTVVGQFTLPEGALPFLAPRKFVTSVADAVGTYNMLGRTVDTTGAAPNSTIQQGQITADGHLLTCDDAQIFDMPNCPAASVTTGTLTVAGNTFTSTTPNGSYTFHVAQVGSDKVYVRDSASSATTRRFIIGTPATTTFPSSTFLGGTTEPSWGTISVTTNSYTSTGIYPTGASGTRNAPAAQVGQNNTLASLLAVNTSYAGNFFGIQSSELGILIAAHGNPFAPGLMAIGHKQ
jgi:hypothetical protein